MEKQEFIKTMAAYIKKYAPQYGIAVCSPIIAQSILESGWGESKLAAQYHNYFGLKCGTRWTGKSVNLKTQEEYQPGTLTTITDNFRVYNSMEEGVAGYFEFIQLPRYQNLRGITDPETYLRTIHEDGYATSSIYVKSNMDLINQFNLTQYDKEEAPGMTEEEVRQLPVNWLIKYLGIAEGSQEHYEILAVFNDSGLCSRYKMTVNDAWCATGASAAMIATGLADIYPCVECSCGRQVEMARAAGIWVEDDAFTPQVGDSILYDWDDSGAGDCTGWPDHVGIIAAVNGGSMTVIECNNGNTVGYRSMAVNGRFIRGFITPDYASAAGRISPGPAPAPGAQKGLTEVAREVIAGHWGNGDFRIQNLTAAGYDAKSVQAEVNRILQGGGTSSRKPEDVIAKEVLAGKWGNGQDRINKLKAAGYNPGSIQSKVNSLLGYGASASLDEVAREVIQGKWGNGQDRFNRLTAAGYDAKSVQRRVNQLL